MPEDTFNDLAEYLGDSVYAKRDPYGGLVLTTDNHQDHLAGNRIVLEPQVLGALVRYIERAKAS